MKAAQHALMRNMNTLTVLNHLRTAGPCTKRQLQAATGLSWGAISNITAQLIECGLLVETHSPGMLGFFSLVWTCCRCRYQRNRHHGTPRKFTLRNCIDFTRSSPVIVERQYFKSAVGNTTCAVG